MIIINLNTQGIPAFMKVKKVNLRFIFSFSFPQLETSVLPLQNSRNLVAVFSESPN